MRTRRKTGLFPLNRKQKSAIVKVVSRWAHTIAGTHTPNMDRVREILAQVYADRTVSRRVKKVTGRGKNKKTTTQWKAFQLDPPKIVEVASPMAFRIAQAVIRGRLSKSDARDAAKAVGIDPAFIATLRRDKLISLKRDNWYRSNSAVDTLWEETLHTAVRGAIAEVFYPSKDAAEEEKKHRARFKTAFKDLPELSGDNAQYNLVNNDVSAITQISRRRSRWSTTEETIQFGNFFCDYPAAPAVRELSNVPWTSGCLNACHSRMNLAQLDSTYSTGYPDAEVLCDLLGLTDYRARWHYDLMHEVPLCMTFETTALICKERPVIKRNASGELHCENGPAVAWSDGCGQYFFDGHALGNYGRKIVEQPETITVDDIRREENEEVKRIMIERYGWGRYLDAIGATVLDRRENWVDNTIEALVTMSEQIPRDTWQNGRWLRGNTDFVQRKLVLACRSTGRQYFLAVPEDTTTCEEGQKWMAEGANCDLVRALKRPVRLVGAS